MTHFEAVRTIRWPSAPQAERTYLICGAPRGGTSMVAGLLHRLGVDLGEFTSGRYEDETLSPFFLKKKGKGLPELRERIRQRNASASVWGWKDPIAIRHIRDIDHDLRNLHLILVTRDPVAVSARFEDVVKTVRTTLRLYRHGINYTVERQLPLAMVSYERAVRHPRQFIHDICQTLWLDQPADLDDLIAFLKPGEYKDLRFRD